MLSFFFVFHYNLLYSCGFSFRFNFVFPFCKFTAYHSAHLCHFHVYNYPPYPSPMQDSAWWRFFTIASYIWNTWGLQEPPGYSKAWEYSSCSENCALDSKLNVTCHTRGFVCTLWELYEDQFLTYSSLKWILDDLYWSVTKRFTKSQPENREIVLGMRGERQEAALISTNR